MSGPELKVLDPWMPPKDWKESVDKAMAQLNEAHAKGEITNLVVVRYHNREPYTTVTSGMTFADLAYSSKLIEKIFFRRLERAEEDDTRS